MSITGNKAQWDHYKAHRSSMEEILEVWQTNNPDRIVWSDDDPYILQLSYMTDQELSLEASKVGGNRTWQPMDTAPTEHGARFLVWHPDIGHVICDRYGGEIVRAWDQEDFDGATHWMLLPKRPPLTTPTI